MKIVTIFAALAAVAFASDVIELTDSNFDEKINSEEVILVEFYAPWCGHCKRLAPEFEKAATALRGSDPSVALAKIDCTAETKSCGTYGVSGYPTLKIFKNGEKSEDYNGPREADGIVKYMRSKAGPSSKLISAVEDLDKFVSGDEHVIVGFFDSEGSDLQKSFQKLADALNEDFRFAHTTTKEVSEKYSFSNNIVIFRPKRLQNKFENSQLKYEGDSTIGTLKTWVNDNANGLVGHRTSGNQGQYKKPLIVAYYDVDYVKNPKGTNYWRNRVLKVAKKLQDEGKKVYFAISDKSDLSHELTEFGLDSVSGDKPTVAGRDSKDQKFILSGEFSMDTLEQFVRDLLEEKLDPYLKSEALPDNTAEPVKTVVAKNFDEIVNNPDKDVLIEFYAPWCGHCKSLAPKWDEVALKMLEEKEITIAKMDATANDVPKSYTVTGFPTLFFVPKDNKDNPKKYEGGREVDDFIKYLAKESTNPLEGWSRAGKKNKKKSEL